MKNSQYPIVSIVIPVFNMRDSIDGTLQSAVEQTYGHIDIVCVDDGSTDGSHEKLESWRRRDGRIRIVTRQNGGLSAARNSGLDAARGDYVVFCDAGDVLHKKALEILLNESISKNADVAVSKCFVKAKTQVKAAAMLSDAVRPGNRTLVSENPLKDLLKHKYVFSSACNKLFRRDAIGEIRFQEGVLFEDWPFVVKVFGSISRFALVEIPLYGYVMQSGSITRSEFSEKKLRGYVAGIESVNEFFSRRRELSGAALKRCAIAASTMIGKVWKARFACPELQKLAVTEFSRLVRERKVLPGDVSLKARARVFFMTRFAGRRSTVGIWLSALALWLSFSVSACLFYPVMMSDPVCRYAPMAEAFAVGDWNLAFHPRFGVLFQTLAGCVVALTGLDGDKALQIIAFGLQALSLVPVWCLFRKIFGGRIAWWAAMLCFFGDDLFRYSLDGLRDSGKCLGFALLGLGIAERKSIWYGAGLFVLISLASYCFAAGMLFFFGWCVYAFSRREWKMLLWPAVGSVLGTASVTVMVHAYTGHWLPAPHYIRYLGGWL